jgi:putative flippase GtrA
MIERHRKVAGQGLRYLVTGSLAAIVDVGVFALLLRLGLAIPVAATISFAAASITNYWLTSRFVFQAKRSATGYLRFLAFALLGLALNVTLTTLLAAYTPLPPVLAKVVAIGICFVFNFTMNSLFVFRDNPRA